MLVDSLPDSNAYELLLWLLRLRRRVRVDGASMVPTLEPGDEVLVDTAAYDRRSPAVGEVIVAQRPDRHDVILIKRVLESLPDGRVILRGDNPSASTDSLEFGPVAPEHLVGKVTSRFA